MSISAPETLKGIIAASGDHTDIPLAAQANGYASFAEGFGPLNGIAVAAGGIPPKRADINGFLNLLSQHTFWQQSGGDYMWSPSLDYSMPSTVVGSDGKRYYSSAASGPGTAAGAQNPTSTTGYWTSATLTVSNASETVAGILKLATQAMVNAGTDALTAITPSTLAARLAALPVPASILGYRNLSLSATGADASVSMSADEIVVADSSHQYKTLRGLSLSASTAVTGVGGLDAGTIAQGTWYAVWCIYNPTAAAAGLLLSLSATAPTLPSGYTYAARIGWIRTDATTNKYPLSYKQVGRVAHYVVTTNGNVKALPAMAAGAAGSISTPTWAPVEWAAYAPPTASSIILLPTNYNNTAMVAPNSYYGAFNSSTNPPPLCNSNNGSANTNQAASASIVIESPYVYWASGGTAGLLQCIGWEDNI